jgi:hypothetical protein
MAAMENMKSAPAPTEKADRPTMPKASASEILARRDRLRSARGVWESHWQEIADRILPRQGSFVTRFSGDWRLRDDCGDDRERDGRQGRQHYPESRQSCRHELWYGKERSERRRESQRHGASSVTTYAVIGGLLVVLLFLVWLAFRSAEGKGRAEAEKRHYQRNSDRARKANEIDEAVLALPDDQLDNELRDR